MTTTETAAANSTYPKGGVLCSKDSFVGNGTLDFQIKCCGKSPALRVAANRYLQPYGLSKHQTNKNKLIYDINRHQKQNHRTT